MNVIVLTSEDIEALKSLALHADANPIELDTLRAMCEKKVKPIGDCPEFTRALSSGFRVVFSIEMQPAGVLQHLSISHTSKNRVIHPAEVEFIMRELGMGEDIHDCFNVWIEPDWPAVNVLRKKD